MALSALPGELRRRRRAGQHNQPCQRDEPLTTRTICWIFYISLVVVEHHVHRIVRQGVPHLAPRCVILPNIRPASQSTSNEAMNRPKE